MIYLLVYNHQYGSDYSAFYEEGLAHLDAIKQMRETLEEWGEQTELDDEDLWDEWPELSGGSEYFEIIQLDVN